MSPFSMTEPTRPLPGALRKRAVATALVGLLAIVLICYLSYWPERFGFTAEQETNTWKQLLSLPIHLNDDVMISLRSGYMLRELGYPAFNRHDLAQASTSYAAPYLFALLRSIAGSNASVLIYAILGMLAVAGTVSTIFFQARSALNGLIIVVALLFCSTSTAFSLNGWDHLFQGLFLVLAAALFLPGQLDRRRLLGISLALAIACLWRPDAAILSIAMIGCSLFEAQKTKNWLPFSLLPFAGIIAPFLLNNIKIFGHLTTTTVRLKVGASPSLQYSTDYLLKYGFFQFSAISLIALLTLFYIAFLFKHGNRRSHLLMVAALATACVAALNSDFLGYGRMFWSPACVMAVVCTRLAPPLLNVNAGDFQADAVRVLPINRFYLPVASPGWLWRRAATLILGVAILVMTTSTITERARASILMSKTYSTSETASQYVLAHWINENLNPKDGPLGFFCLGVSYHLPRFEIADFLGKADELIAQSKLKWGPPGHNKWDIAATLTKWKPQAVIPNRPADFADKQLLKQSQQDLLNKVDYGFLPALITDPTISRDYDYCHVRPGIGDLEDSWGLFLRKDIAARIGKAASCHGSALANT